MIATHTVLMAAFSSMVLAAPAFAAPADQRSTGIAPCDASPLDGYYEPVAFRPNDSYFPDDEEVLPDTDEQAAPGDDDEAEQGDAPSAGGKDKDARDREGCADIMVAPYDFMVRPPETSPEPVTLRHRHRVAAQTRT